MLAGSEWRLSRGTLRGRHRTADDSNKIVPTLRIEVNEVKALLPFRQTHRRFLRSIQAAISDQTATRLNKKEHQSMLTIIL
jgi:hypothetical protein